MSDVTTNQKCSKDANAVKTNIDKKDKWISFCVDLVRTEGMADMHAGQKTGGVQKRLNQVDCDRPDVRGIPSPRNKYVGKRDIAIKKIERSKGMLQMPLTYGLTMNPPAQKVPEKTGFILKFGQFQMMLQLKMFKATRG